MRTVAPRPQGEEDEDEAQETRDLPGEEGFLGQEAPLNSAGAWFHPALPPVPSTWLGQQPLSGAGDILLYKV